MWCKGQLTLRGRLSGNNCKTNCPPEGKSFATCKIIATDKCCAKVSLL
jgi:hypothetical protein